MVEQTLLRQLRALPPDDWIDIVLRVNAYHQVGTNQKNQSPAAGSPDYLLDGVHDELRRRGLLGASARIPARAMPLGFATRSEALRQQLESHINLRTHVAQQKVLLGRMLGRALADYLSKANVPVTPKTMLNNIDKVPVALDASFPGYLSAGILPFCWHSRR